MNIKHVSIGMIGAALMGGVLSGCSEHKYENEAKSKAVKYLRGDELLKAEKFARQQNNYDKYSGEAIAYWDSLLIEAKTKEAYTKGLQVIQDSIYGKPYTKMKLKPQFDTIVAAENVIDSSRKEYAELTSAEDFIKAKNNAPNDCTTGFYNNLVGSTHYWNLITLTEKQNEAYQQGMADIRKVLGID